MTKLNYRNVLDIFHKMTDPIIKPKVLPKKYCASCGKCLTYQLTQPDGEKAPADLYGVVLSFVDTTDTAEAQEIAKDNFGVFEPGHYYFCFECALKSLGAKP